MINFKIVVLHSRCKAIDLGLCVISLPWPLAASEHQGIWPQNLGETQYDFSSDQIIHYDGQTRLISLIFLNHEYVSFWISDTSPVLYLNMFPFYQGIRPQFLVTGAITGNDGIIFRATKGCRRSRVRHLSATSASQAAPHSIQLPPKSPFPYPERGNPTPHQIFHLPHGATRTEIKTRCMFDHHFYYFAI